MLGYATSVRSPYGDSESATRAYELSMKSQANPVLAGNVTANSKVGGANMGAESKATMRQTYPLSIGAFSRSTENTAERGGSEKDKSVGKAAWHESADDVTAWRVVYNAPFRG
jgi:hypothetical protein